MRRVVSVWLPHWKTERLERRQSRRHHSTGALEAFALTEAGKGGRRLAAVNQTAEASGLRRCMVLTDACAILPALATAPSDPAQENAGLERLAAWCRRYTPWTAPEAPDGLTLDVTGACHLLGGEEALLDDLIARLSAFGLTARAAMAATPGAAWALARHARTNRTIVPEGEEGRFLAPLSVRGLRLGDTEVLLLERLGLKTMGQLFHMPRETLRARLGARMLRRLDQALGAEAEPVSPHALETLYAARLTFPDPVTSMESLTHVAELLANQAAGQLRQDGKGARHYTLTFYDTQGDAFDVSITLAQPSHRPGHVLRLFREKFASLEGRFDETLAFDTATLYATRVEPLVTLQSSLTDEESSSVEQQERLTNLIDCLVARLGIGAVTRFDFPESHIPERASLDLPVLRKTSARPQLGGRRPLLVLPRAEPLRVLAEVPDYPPRRFTWRGLDYRVVKAEGPERIAPEWWQTEDDDSSPRDYYAVEDESGRRFWLYREGQYQSEAMPRWYLQGMFA